MERKPPEVNLVSGINSFTGADTMSRIGRDEVKGVTMVETMEKALEKSRRVSVSKTAEQKADMNIKKITEMHSYESPDMINNIWKDSTIEDQLKEA